MAVGAAHCRYVLCGRASFVMDTIGAAQRSGGCTLDTPEREFLRTSHRLFLSLSPLCCAELGGTDHTARTKAKFAEDGESFDLYAKRCRWRW